MNKYQCRKIIKKFEQNNGTLTKKFVISSVWVFLLRIAEQLLNFSKLLILARFLAPSDFGLMGIAFLTMSILETFSQTGFYQALIHKKNNIIPYLDDVWTASVLRGFILFFILFLIAPHAAIFFDSPEAEIIIRAIGITIIFKSCTNIGVIYFQKELEFNRQFVYQLSKTLTDFVVSIIAVLLIRNTWALVYGTLAGSLMMCIVSYLIHPYRPKISLNVRNIKELSGYGKWVMGSTILVFLITEGDDIFVGKLLSTSALGLYQMAYRFSNISTTEITHVISQVTFPFYSKIQDDISRLRDIYLKVFQIITFLSCPITGLTIVLAPDFTRIFLGDEWLQMVLPMQILAISGFLRSIGAISGNLFYAVGKTKIDTKLQAIRLFILGALIYPLTIKWGLAGTSTAVLISFLLSDIGFSIISLKLIRCGIKRYIYLLIIPLIATLFSSIILLVIKSRIMEMNIYEFILVSVSGVSIYILTLFLIDKKSNYNILLLLKEYVINLKGHKETHTKS